MRAPCCCPCAQAAPSFVSGVLCSMFSRDNARGRPSSVSRLPVHVSANPDIQGRRLGQVHEVIPQPTYVFNVSSQFKKMGDLKNPREKRRKIPERNRCFFINRHICGGGLPSCGCRSSVFHLFRLSLRIYDLDLARCAGVGGNNREHWLHAGREGSVGEAAKTAGTWAPCPPPLQLLRPAPACMAGDPHPLRAPLY